jgi:hypothetical protein
MPLAVAGNGGHDATFNAACRLVEFWLSFEQASPLLADWNETHCLPKWSDAELNHKLAEAFKRTGPKPEFAPKGSGIASASAPTQIQSAKPAADSSKRVISNPRATFPRESELLSLADKFHVGTPQDIEALAKLRGLSVAGVALASARGFLRFGRYHGEDAWILLDASHQNACARRMDGLPWNKYTMNKSTILRGSKARLPIGIREAQNFPTVLLCEGAPDLLAAFHFVAIQGREADCAPVAILSATYRIPAEVLPLFTGKRVRIFEHDDNAGWVAAETWKNHLNLHGVEADIFSFFGFKNSDSRPVKDLNGFANCDLTGENGKLLAKLLP